MRRYLLRVRRTVVVAALVTGLSACGASSPSTGRARIAFGIGGGNIAPFQVTIEPTGFTRASGSRRPTRHGLSRSEVVALSSLVHKEFAAGVKSRRCPGTNPDVASEFIRAYGRTVTVHGACEPRLQRLWNTLVRAVGLPAGGG